MIALSTVQSSAQTFIHTAILFIDMSNNGLYNQAHLLLGAPYLSIIASNVLILFFLEVGSRFTWFTFIICIGFARVVSF